MKMNGRLVCDQIIYLLREAGLSGTYLGSCRYYAFCACVDSDFNYLENLDFDTAWNDFFRFVRMFDNRIYLRLRSLPLLYSLTH